MGPEGSPSIVNRRGVLHNLRCRHATDHCIAVIPARLGIENGLYVPLHEQHGDNNNVTLSDGGPTIA